jgi:hypothetical protein
LWQTYRIIPLHRLTASCPWPGAGSPGKAQGEKQEPPVRAANLLQMTTRS